MKHKHADVIHAWADGAEIQVKNEHGEWEDWKDEESPSWFASWEYRIKPNACQCMTREKKKPVVRWLWAFKAEGAWRTMPKFYAEDELKSETPLIKLEWSRTEFTE